MPQQSGAEAVVETKGSFIAEDEGDGGEGGFRGGGYAGLQADFDEVEGVGYDCCHGGCAAAEPEGVADGGLWDGLG